MNRQRPVNLDLLSLKFPPMAIASILHRLSGLLLFIFFPLLLICLQQAFASEAAFQALNADLHRPLARVLLWLFGSALFYHALAGIRHMLMDLGLGESLSAARRSSLALLAVSVLFILSLGIALC